MTDSDATDDLDECRRNALDAVATGVGGQTVDRFKGCFQTDRLAAVIERPQPGACFVVEDRVAVCVLVRAGQLLDDVADLVQADEVDGLVGQRPCFDPAAGDVSPAGMETIGVDPPVDPVLGGESSYVAPAGSVAV